MLPPNWTKYTTDDGKAYYHNHVTNQTQWDFPMASAEPVASKTLTLSGDPKPKVVENASKPASYGLAQQPTPAPLFGADLPCACCLPSLEFLHKGFNVSTSQVTMRLLAASNPLPAPISEAFLNAPSATPSAPDLYGPFWIATTAVFSMTMSSNFVTWMSWSGNGKFYADYLLTWTAACVLYGSLFLVPAILWLLNCRGQLGDAKLDLSYVVSIFGYSLWPLIAVSIICAIPSSFLHTIACGLGFLAGLGVCWKYLFLAPGESLTKTVKTMVLASAGLGLVLVWGVYRFHFLKI